MLNTNLAYLAGLLDADGWFSIQRSIRPQKQRAPSYSPSVGVTNTSKELVSWLLSTFGGFIRERPPAEDTIGTKIRYEWRLQVSEIRQLLPKLIPYLICKKRRAELLIELLATSNTAYRRVGVPASVQHKREDIYQELRAITGTQHPIVKI